MRSVLTSPDYVELTAGDDGLTHGVALAIYDRYVAEGRGRYLALCGRTVLAAAMTTRPGPACPTCREVVRRRR